MNEFLPSHLLARQFWEGGSIDSRCQQIGFARGDFAVGRLEGQLDPRGGGGAVGRGRGDGSHAAGGIGRSSGECDSARARKAGEARRQVGRSGGQCPVRWVDCRYPACGVGQPVRTAEPLGTAVPVEKGVPGV